MTREHIVILVRCVAAVVGLFSGAGLAILVNAFVGAWLRHWFVR